LAANTGTPASDRPPPRNIDAERSVIGSILIDGSQVWRVYGWLAPTHFYDSELQLVYATICNMADAGEAIDLLTVRDAVMAAAPDAVHMGAFVASLVDGIPDIANVERYGRIVKRDADRRRAMVACEQATASFATSQDVRGQASSLLDVVTDLLDANDGRNATETASDLVKSALRSFDEGVDGATGVSGITTGYRSLDSIIHGFPRGAVSLILAPPRTGKTTLALNCALNAAEAGFHVLYFSIDMPKKFVGDRLLSIASGVDTDFVKTGAVSHHGLYGGMSRDDLIRSMLDGAARIHRIPDSGGSLEINDTSDDIAQIIAECTVRSRMSKLDIVFIDYLQQVQTGSHRTENEHRRISLVATKLRSMARTLNIAVVPAAQPNRTLGRGEVMQLRHIAESSSLEQVPRVALSLYRPGAEDGAEQLPCDIKIYVIKNEGKTGIAQLHGEMWAYRVTESEHDHNCYFDRGRR